MTRVFLDTNILVYADDADAGAKRQRSRDLLLAALRTGNGVISTQVLQEYFVVATRKLGLAPDIAHRKAEILASLPVIVIDVDHVFEAIKLHRLYQLSFWDALIVRAAKIGGCTQLLTEDLQHRQSIEGVEVINPFLP